MATSFDIFAYVISKILCFVMPLSYFPNTMGKS